RSLVVSALLMMGTGYVFAFTQWYPLLLIAAFCGTISPSTNDNTPFSGIEQAILAQTSRAKHPTALFALYNLAAQFAGAIGGLAVGLLEVLSHAGIAAPVGMRYLFLLYGLLAGSTGLLFLRLSPAAELQTPKEKTSSGSSGTGTSMQEGTSTQEVTSTQKPCRVPQQRKIRGIILKLSSLFALDAFAGGLAVQTILAIWFRLRFGVFLACPIAFQSGCSPSSVLYDDAGVSRRADRGCHLYDRCTQRRRFRQSPGIMLHARWPPTCARPTYPFGKLHRRWL